MNTRSWWSLGRDRAAPQRPPQVPLQRLTAPKVIVIGNEKGGAGKTTVASLLSTAMCYRGARVAVIDLDLRQSSFGRFLANRRRWVERAGSDAPIPLEYKLATDTDELSRADAPTIIGLFEQAITLAMRGADIIVIDTPGGDTPVSRAAHLQGDIVVTPMNDSFVDFDVLGRVDPLTLELVRPSHYARVVHEARRTRGSYGRQLDWVVMPNRLAPIEARNRERLQRDVEALGSQIGFRIGPSLNERVIYRELFPFGLTVADILAGVRPIKLTNPRDVVRAELDGLLGALGLDGIAFGRPPTAPHPQAWRG